MEPLIAEGHQGDTIGVIKAAALCVPGELSGYAQQRSRNHVLGCTENDRQSALPIWVDKINWIVYQCLSNGPVNLVDLSNLVLRRMFHLHF